MWNDFQQKYQTLNKTLLEKKVFSKRVLKLAQRVCTAVGVGEGVVWGDSRRKRRISPTELQSCLKVKLRMKPPPTANSSCTDFQQNTKPWIRHFLERKKRVLRKSYHVWLFNQNDRTKGVWPCMYIHGKCGDNPPKISTRMCMLYGKHKSQVKFVLSDMCAILYVPFVKMG